MTGNEKRRDAMRARNAAEVLPSLDDGCDRRLDARGFIPRLD